MGSAYLSELRRQVKVMAENKKFSQRLKSVKSTINIGAYEQSYENNRQVFQIKIPQSTNSSQPSSPQ